MDKKPEFKLISGLEYGCTACDLKIEINYHKKLNAGQIKKHLDAQLAKHIKEHHSTPAKAEDVNQAARVVREATERD